MPEWLVTFSLLAVGGGVGANARYWLGKLIAHFQGEVEFPFATFAINVSGSLLLGVVASNYLRHPDPAMRTWYLLLGTGFCGGFTTFSTFSLETLELIQDGRVWLAVVYVLGSVLAGLLGVWLAVKFAGGPPPVG